MQGPRDRDQIAKKLTDSRLTLAYNRRPGARRRQLRALTLLALMALASLAGCRGDSPAEHARQTEEYRRQLTSRGQRVMVTDPEHKTAVKLRKRRGEFKVYGTDLAPEGFVRWNTMPGTVRSASEGDSEAEKKDHTSGEKEQVSEKKSGAKTSASAQSEDVSGRSTHVWIRALGSETLRQLEPTDARVGASRAIVLKDAYELHEYADFWQLYGTNGESVGRFERLENGDWRLDLSDGPGTDSGAKNASSRRFLARKSDSESGASGDLSAAVLRVFDATDGLGQHKEVDEELVEPALNSSPPRLHPVELLAFELPGLSRLEQLSVGVWLAHNAQSDESEP